LAVVSRAGDLGRPQKKECLIFTNKANMLLKTKDRVYEQSQTKPIEATKLLKTNEIAYEQSHYVIENKGSLRLTKLFESVEKPGKTGRQFLAAQGKSCGL